MKVAAITDDGRNISQHFGRAQYYMVITVSSEGKIVERQLRTKLGHNQLASLPHEAEDPSRPHGMGTGSHNKHLMMSDVIVDCEALLCGGMGRGAHQSLQMRGIKPVVTDIEEIDQAVLAYAKGEIEDRVDLLH